MQSSTYDSMLNLIGFNVAPLGPESRWPGDVASVDGREIKLTAEFYSSFNTDLRQVSKARLETDFLRPALDGMARAIKQVAEASAKAQATNFSFGERARAAKTYPAGYHFPLTLPGASSDGDVVVVDNVVYGVAHRYREDQIILDRPLDKEITQDSIVRLFKFREELKSVTVYTANLYGDSHLFNDVWINQNSDELAVTLKVLAGFLVQE